MKGGYYQYAGAGCDEPHLLDDTARSLGQVGCLLALHCKLRPAVKASFPELKWLYISVRLLRRPGDISRQEALMSMKECVNERRK